MIILFAVQHYTALHRTVDWYPHPQSVGEHDFHRVREELSRLCHLLPVLQMSLQYGASLTVIRQVVLGKRTLALQHKAIPPSLLRHRLQTEQPLRNMDTHTRTQNGNNYEIYLKIVNCLMQKQAGNKYSLTTTKIYTRRFNELL